MIAQIDSALDARRCGRLIEAFRSGGENCQWQGDSGGVLYLEDMPARERRSVVAAVAACYRAFAARWSVTGKLYAETILISAMGRGDHHHWHADNCRLDAFGQWVPNHSPNRALSMLCYLNRGFSGGDLWFEAFDEPVRPAPGLLVAFPSDHEHVHGVEPIRRGTRYALVAWWTQRKGCENACARGLGVAG